MMIWAVHIGTNCRVNLHVDFRFSQKQISQRFVTFGLTFVIIVGGCLLVTYVRYVYGVVYAALAVTVRILLPEKRCSSPSRCLTVTLFCCLGCEHCCSNVL